jgi:hypothetical protein
MAEYEYENLGIAIESSGLLFQIYQQP